MAATLERKTVAFELKAVGDDGGWFEGYAAVFNNIDWWGDIIAPGAFQDTLPQFLKEGFVGGLNHGWSDPIGKPLEASEDQRGLFVKGSIEETAHGKDCRVLIKEGVVKKMSIGFLAKDRSYLETAEEVEKYWQSVGYTPSEEDRALSKCGARLLTKVRLYEFSPVTLPANGRADITDAKSGPDGLPALHEHSLQVIEDLEGLVKRLSGTAQKRSGEGKTLAPQHVISLKRAQDAITQLLAVPDEALAPRVSDLKRAAIKQVATLQELLIGGPSIP
jgi:HK97 family phage prohead protease